MQAIAPVMTTDFLGPVQRMRYKVEVYTPSVTRTDFLAGWLFRVRLDLPIPDANLVDFPVKIPIIADADIGAECLANGYDIRFAAADGTTLLPHERESWAGGGGAPATAIFWVKTDVSMAGTFIWCYYGNAGAADASTTVQDPELIANGGFDANTGSWTANLGTIDSVAGGKAGNCLRATADGTGQSYTSQVVTTVALQQYILRYYSKEGTTNVIEVSAGTNWFLTDISYDGFGATGSWVARSQVFSAPGISAYINIMNNYGGAGATVYLDSISLKIFHSTEWADYQDAQELDADGGLTWGAEEDTILIPATWHDLSLLGGSGGDDYLKSVSLSLGGAGISTNPIAGTWSAIIDNPLGIFHPKHPTSFYADLLRVGREVRISIGGNYGAGAGVDYYWQRLIGFMDAPRFDHNSHTVEISGMDYMKLLADTVLRDVQTITESGSGSGSTLVGDQIHGPSHWGSRTYLSTIATIQTLGAEIYAEADAMEIGAGEANNVANWAPSDTADFTSIADFGGGSTWVGKFVRSGPLATVQNSNVGAVTAGTEYVCSFKYRYANGTDGSLELKLYESGTLNLMGSIAGLNSSSWAQVSFNFTATASVNVAMRFKIALGDNGDYFYIDEISIKDNAAGGVNVAYELPEDCNGPYLVSHDGSLIWLGDPPEDFGWTYSEATRVIGFADGAIVANGSDNLLVYYYTTQTVENVVADLMVVAGLYATRAAALADMDYTPTGVTINRVWFNSGTTALGAVRMLCERVNYRFWFAYDGQPCFKPAPVAGSVDFTFTDFGHLQGETDFQDVSVVRNRVIIDGAEQAMYATRDDQTTSKWTYEDADLTSIAAYLENTYQLANHLFQDQTSVDAMCAEILAEFKDPKWYSDLTLFANPVPLELGDVVQWPLELEPVDEVGGSGSVEVTMLGIIRDIKINDATAQYKVEVVDALGSGGGGGGSSSGSSSGAPSGSASTPSGSASASASAGSSGSPTLTEELITSSQAWTPPTGFSGDVLIETWGAGGKGGTSTDSDNGCGGGGGGAYSESTIACAFGVNYSIQVGDAGNRNVLFRHSYFKNDDTSTTLVKAAGGLDVANGESAGSEGGSSASGIGSTKYSGGRGADAVDDTGGGGGGAAGSSGTGEDAVGQNGGTTTSEYGGPGGDGGSPDNVGDAPVSDYGGGGGGAGSNFHAGAEGSDGLVRLTYWL